MGDTELYDVLEVDRHSNPNQIKASYRKLAKKYHPDKNPEFGDKFKEISFAYEVLSNPEKKEVYDRHGLEGLKEGRSAHGMDFGGLFGGLFGGMGGMFGGPMMGGFSRGPRKGEDTTKAINVTLEDFYNGKVSKLQVTRSAVCSDCSGTGSRSGKVNTCQMCGGQGVKVVLRQLGPGMVQQMQRECPNCRGRGEVISDKDKCRKCDGDKVKQETKVLEVYIDKGMPNGHRIPFRNQGDAAPGVEAGDVIIMLNQVEHKHFTRKGLDLFFTHTLTLTEALCGFKLVIKHLDKREIVMEHNYGVVKPGTIKMVRGEGMPRYRNPSEKGNLLIKFDVEMPPQYFGSDKTYESLLKLLPPQPNRMEPLPDTEPEEVNLMEYEERSHRGGGGRYTGEAYDSDDDEDEPMGGGQRVQCASQ